MASMQGGGDKNTIDTLQSVNLVLSDKTIELLGQTAVM